MGGGKRWGWELDFLFTPCESFVVTIGFLCMVSTWFSACNSYNFAWDSREVFVTDDTVARVRAWAGWELVFLEGGIRFSCSINGFWH